MALPKLIAKSIGLIALIVILIPLPSLAGDPVLDITNLTENAMSAGEEVAQTLKQVEQYTTQLQQYQTQLQQYQNMIQNTTQPLENIWNQAQPTISGLMSVTNTLNGYKAKLGSLDGYLQKFQDINYYKSSPCFTSAGCPPQELAKIKDAQAFASQAQKAANDALLKGNDSQQTSIQTDAANLEKLQSAATSADGHLAALGYANQLAGNQAHQLLQIRTTTMAFQNSVATKMQIEADVQAQQQAAAVNIRRGGMTARTPERKW
jgi:P-type conjugative transfer protein TrbJ